jgi:hypothetical protein
MEEQIQIGCAQQVITPRVGTPLSGFIFRENKPSVGIDSPLHVRVLAVRQGAYFSLLVSFELLGISQDLEQHILSCLEQKLGPSFSRSRCVLLATHTHSAPLVSPLEGESKPDPEYIQLVCEKAASAAQQAIRQLTHARLFFTSLRLPGLTYNRRAVLADGRVSMALHPDSPVLERGPVDDTLSVLVWRSLDGKNLAVLTHFGCHGAAVCTQYIHGDIPGEISKRVGVLFDAPCIYIQGVTGDVNPLTTSGERPAMLEWVDQFMVSLRDLPTLLEPLPSIPFRTVSSDLPLVYQPLPDRETVEQNIRGLSKIAHGDVESPEVQLSLKLLSDLMNFRPGERPDPGKAAFAAHALMSAEKRTLAAIENGQPLPPCPLRVSLWRMGQVGFAFVAAELFAITGFQIRAAGIGIALLPATYAACIVGYLPDRESMQKGGYEVRDAWRFYRQPGPFMPSSEEYLVNSIRNMAKTL